MSEPNIQITDQALAHIRRQLDLTQAGYLRLGVKESGCNGFMYMLDYLEAPEQEDICIEFPESVSVCVAAEDLQMVSGTEVDMLTQGLNTALVFKNPNATSYCGCGESFAVGGEPDDLDTSGAADLATNVGTSS
ncbi:MAG: iron-sulfur cluster assembly accessory protein [Pseudomonadales bacterium]|nr:iron-sulfur cluster assembly accessory protein [Pseudomonadales bacterium]